MKINFDKFQVQKWISQIVRAQKVDEKNGVICLAFFFPSWVLVLILPKLCRFCNFLLMSVKKSKAVIAIHVYASESSSSILPENGIGYYAMT